MNIELGRFIQDEITSIIYISSVIPNYNSFEYYVRIKVSHVLTNIDRITFSICYLNLRTGIFYHAKY